MDTNAEAFINHEWTRMKWRFGTTNEHEWTRMNVARAFQPEICPRRPDCQRIDAVARSGVQAGGASREDARGQAEHSARYRVCCPLKLRALLHGAGRCHPD